MFWIGGIISDITGGGNITIGGAINASSTYIYMSGQNKTAADYVSPTTKEYKEWQTEDKKTLSKINKLIQDIQRNGYLKGLGKPAISICLWHIMKIVEFPAIVNHTDLNLE